MHFLKLRTFLDFAPRITSDCLRTAVVFAAVDSEGSFGSCLDSLILMMWCCSKDEMWCFRWTSVKWKAKSAADWWHPPDSRWTVFWGVLSRVTLFYSARGVAPDLAMQALKLINNLDVWQIWFEALPQDCTVVMLIQPVRPTITDTWLQGSGATFIFLRSFSHGKFSSATLILREEYFSWG